MLLFRREFGPLFVTQFFGAFNDNCMKTALLVMVSFLLGYPSEKANALTNLAMGLFILPYFLFSGIAGRLADRFDKAIYCRYVKLWEIVLMAFAFPAFVFQWVNVLFALLFLMGMQSAFFGPAKYSLLPQHLKERELVDGNAWIEGGTYLAILVGMVAGSVLIKHESSGPLLAGSVLCAFSLVGFAGSCGIPSAPPYRIEAKRRNYFAENGHLLWLVWSQPVIRFTVLAVSLFWMVGALYVSQLLAICGTFWPGNSQVFTVGLTLFSIGVGAGSFLCSRLLRGEISCRFSWIGGLMMAVFTFDLWWLLGSAGAAANAGDISLYSLVGTFLFWRVMIDMLLVAIGGGLYSVPLQSLMQHRARPGETARVIAGNNLVNAFCMAGGSIAAAGLVAYCGLTPAAMLLGMFGVTLMMTVYSWFYRKIDKESYAV